LFRKVKNITAQTIDKEYINFFLNVTASMLISTRENLSPEVRNRTDVNISPESGFSRLEFAPKEIFTDRNVRLYPKLRLEFSIYKKTYDFSIISLDKTLT